MSLFATINHGLHLTSAVLWIGGVAFQVLIFAPLLKNHPLPAAFLHTLSNRFRIMVMPLTLILIVTGALNFGIRRAGQEMPVPYVTALGIKVFLVALVTSVHFFIGLTPPVPENDKTISHRLPGLSSNRLTLTAGLIILLIASMLRHFRF
jgi:putative copper export protein